MIFSTRKLLSKEASRPQQSSRAILAKHLKKENLQGITQQRAARAAKFPDELALAKLGGYMRPRLAASGCPEQFDCGQLVRGLEWPQE
jgi:hypothetical protein